MNNKYKSLSLPVAFLSILLVSACQTKPVTTERNENIKIISPYSNSNANTDGQCYKITAENKDYYGRLDKNGNPLEIPELEDKDIKISLTLLRDSECKEKGI
ncbi:hypothetical protein [Providencia burhodogranariea]|uniref:Lipoprotein n=1 Tax=Providencia burhodogranariea DSM 19968 TaxID=1141662 RepID=K8X7V1_9GAMM|nr:hypothetical protein [Providencia burhodogranariea]EKT64490.1 hypothetical protein OOA_02722 [Providencia burhodogranariea DSM 19968]